MTSIGPGVRDVSSPAPGEKKNRVTLAGIGIIVASVTGNGIQWWSSAVAAEKSRAEAGQLRQESEKTAAEIRQMKQDQEESGTRSIQSWLDQLKKFDAVEDRVMVLSAAIATSSDPRVKQWAQDQLGRLQNDLSERQKAAEQQAALVGPIPATPGSAARPPPTALDPSSSPPRPVGSSSSPAPPTALPPRTAAATSRALATKDLARVNRAQQLMLENLKR